MPVSSFHRGTRVAAVLLGVVTLVGVTVPLANADTTAPISDPASGAKVEPLPDHALVFHVDASATLTDQTDGSVEHPLPSLAWGTAFADHYRKRGWPVRLMVAPGAYREKLTIGWAGAPSPPLVIESEVPGEAIVTGADVATVTPVPGSERYTMPWTADWGMAPIPGSWSSVNVPDGIRRREAVFVDGTPLVQVLTEAELVAGTFFVDEAGDRILVHPPAGIDSLEDHLVEVAMRERAFEVKGLASNVTVRGFVFEAAAAPFEKHMAYISDSTDILIEDNVFQHSSWGGLGLCCTTGVTLRGNQIRDNGGNGLDTYRTTNALIEGNLVTGNNVRGSRHGYHGWSAAGSKNLLLRRAVFRDNEFRGNLTRGLWFDTDVADVLLDRVTSCGNLTDGLFIEATQGPLTIHDSTFCDNGRAGILVGTSGNVTLQDSTLSGNPYGQLVFSGERHRSWIDHITGILIEVPDFEDWTLTGNTFRSDDGAPLIYSPVIPIDEWRETLRAGEIVAESNTWIRPTMDGAIMVQSTPFPMEEWIALTGDTPTIIDDSTEDEREEEPRQPARQKRTKGAVEVPELRAQAVERWPAVSAPVPGADAPGVQDSAGPGTVVATGATPVIDGALALVDTPKEMTTVDLSRRRCVTGGSRCGIVR